MGEAADWRESPGRRNLAAGAGTAPVRMRSEPEPMANRHGGLMRRFAGLTVAALVMTSCSPEQDVTGSIHNKCATELYSCFNPKAMDQCMAVCIKCDRGTTATCSTSCTLKGAR